MTFVRRAVCGGVLFASMASLAWCGERGPTGLVAVPFAVPVAVPVAVVQAPVALYGYSRFAPRVGSTPVESTAIVPQADPVRHTAEDVFRRHCSACHGGAAPAAGLHLFEADGALRDRLPRQKVLAAVVADEKGNVAMPPAGRDALTAAELDALRQWSVPPADLEY